MSDASKALAEVRGWLCDNLGSGDAGKVCGMLSVVSRRINELLDENAKLREFSKSAWQVMTHNEPLWVWKDMAADARELGIEENE